MSKNGLEELIDISNFYGKDPAYVLANGGNTSWKDERIMYVKASGTTLAGIGEEEFVRMDMEKLKAIWEKSYSPDPDVREEQALEDLMAARMPGETARPSVETLLHALFPRSFVIHLHPAIVNGMTCGVKGEAAALELFGSSALWVPIANPGYILAKTVKEKIDEFMARGNSFPDIVFLQNHGVFAADNSAEGIKKIYEKIMSALQKRASETADLGPASGKNREVEIWKSAVKKVLDKPHCSFLLNREIEKLIQSEESFEPLSSSYTPDHIVYYGHEPMFIAGTPSEAGANGAESLIRDSLDTYTVRNHGIRPRVVAVEKLGLFAAGDSEKQVEIMIDLLLDALKISVYSGAFGGHNFMKKDKIDFIVTWEVEKYRSNQQLKD